MTAPRGVNAGAYQTVTGLPRYVLPLGFTSPPLSLNGRYHWRTRARLVKAIRTAVVVRGRQVGMKATPHVYVELHYVPRDNRDRDQDNLVATLKPAIDALTAAGQHQGRICLAVVRDDTPDCVTWAAPIIHPRDEHGPRLWLEVQYLAGPPDPAAWQGVRSPLDPRTGRNPR